MRLIVGAFPPETALLEDLNGSEFRVSSTGIGPVEALIGLEALVIEFGPREVIFLGSGGLYPSPPGPGGADGNLSQDYVWSRCFTFFDPGSLQGRSRMVPAMRQFATPLPGQLSKTLVESGSFLEGLVNTTVSLSLEAYGIDERTLADSVPGLAESGLSQSAHGSGSARPVLENLEAFSLARFCEIHKIEFTAFLAVTNTVGPGGSEEWSRHYRSMAETLQEKVRPVLENWRG